jgi:sulfite exporter TauE/SafE
METLLSHCHTTLSPHQPLLAGLFLAGLLGGFTHCMGMCGPFVLAQSMQPAGRGEGLILRRLSSWALLPYHLGRATTYAALGATAALLSRQIIGTPFQHALMATLLAMAGVVFLMQFFKAFIPAKAGISRRSSRGSRIHGNHMAKYISRLARPFFAAPNGMRGYVLGLMLGLLPCGLVYGALMMVAVTATPLAAAFGMALFALGTLPALWLVSSGGHALQRWKPTLVPALSCSLMALNGLMLIVLAGQSLT